MYACVYVCACVHACLCLEDSLDETVLHVDVGMERLIIVDDAAAFDQEPLTLPRHREKEAPIKTTKAS